jgi:predicted dehydrogenase
MTVRVGIIGTGWGRMHIGAFRAAGADVAVLCGRDLEKTRAIAARESIRLATDRVEALCAEVEVVVVASPDGLHLDHVRAAIDARKHVLCEKPLATRVDDARALVALAARSGLKCAVGFPYRQLLPVRGLRSWLSARPSVRELDVTLRSSFVSTLEGSGDFGGASHVIDAALWLTGSGPEWVCATVRGGSLQLSWPGFNLVHRPTVEPGIHGSWSLCGDGWEAGFFGGYQPALGGWRVSAPRAFFDGAWREVAPGIEPRPHQREPWAEAHVAAARAFLDGEMARLSSFAEAERVQAVLDAAARSNASGRRETVAPPGA